jgi:hypothetical protein
MKSGRKVWTEAAKHIGLGVGGRLIKSVNRTLQHQSRIQLCCVVIKFEWHTKKIPVDCSSVTGRFHCVSEFTAEWKMYIQVLFSKNM